MRNLGKLAALFVLMLALVMTVPALAQDAVTPATLEGNWLTGCASRPEADGTTTYFSWDWLFLGVMVFLSSLNEYYQLFLLKINSHIVFHGFHKQYIIKIHLL